VRLIISTLTLGGVDTTMRKFNSSALLTPHSYLYLLAVSELLDSANKIHPNTDVEIKVLFLYHFAWHFNLCVLSIQARQALSSRFATPDDVAGLASFLVSEDAAMITGMLNITSYK